MSDRGRFSVREPLLALLALLLLANSALAYAGPVPGPEFFGYFLSLLAWLGVAFGALLMWPLHALRQRFRRGRVPGAADEPGAAVPEPQGQTEGACPQP
jgi:hypothetical protein